jgi:4a-hydroxytetrahydrobiopterin dehydratase
MEKLTKDEIQSRIKVLNGWKFANDGIEKDFLFRDFSEAFSFMGRVALLSEKIGHHPDWSGVNNKVHIRLNTHEVGGVTKNDIDMATQIEQFIK